MEKKFKPFDQVLVKSLTDEKWTPDLYSYYDDIRNLHWSIGSGWVSNDNILPYEGNEHLVGTTDEPDEEVRLEEGEIVVFFDSINDLVNFSTLGIFSSNNREIFCDVVGRTWNYAIRFSDFNPKDMEETSRHILCVKNGKIVKYKEN